MIDASGRWLVSHSYNKHLHEEGLGEYNHRYYNGSGTLAEFFSNYIVATNLPKQSHFKFA